MRPLLRTLILLPLAALAACNTAGPDGRPNLASPQAEGQTASLPRFRPGTLTPEALKGLRDVQVSDSLGDPSFRRRDPPAEIWQYRVPGCTLDLFLYEERDGAGKVVAHYAVRVPSGTAITDRACLDEVQARRDGAPTS